MAIAFKWDLAKGEDRDEAVRRLLREALEKGVVDAVLITKHPLDIMKVPIESGEVRLLPWSKSALEAVTRAFPTETRLTVLPLNTYDGQQEDIQGYASY